MYLIFLTNVFEIFLVLRAIRRDIIINVHTSSCKKRIILFILIFSTNFRKKKSQISNLVEIRPMKATLLHAIGRKDGETDEHNKPNGRVS
jgi:hypothetical protein